MNSPIPADLFSRTLRQVQDNPESFGSGSTVHARDFYGNAETWVIETYRIGDRVTVFLQFNSAEGGKRFVLPAEVVGRILQHHDSLIKRARRRAARKAVDTKRDRGTLIAPIAKKATP